MKILVVFTGIIESVCSMLLANPRVTARLLDSEEIREPKHGYFSVEDLHIYCLDKPKDENHAGELYREWQAQAHDIPAFFFADEDEEGRSGGTAYIVNRYTWKQLTDLRCDDADGSRSYHTRWSVGSRRALKTIKAFHKLRGGGGERCGETMITDGVRDSFFNEMRTVDLSRSVMTEDWYPKLGSIQHLRQLALPMDGSDLSNPRFVANEGVQELVVWNTVITDQVIKKIGEFRSLQRLILNGCTVGFPVDEAGSKVMQNSEKLFRKIRDISVVNCDLTVVRLVSKLEFPILAHGTFDYIPSGSWVSELNSVTILVDEEFEEAFSKMLPVYARALGVKPQEVQVTKAR